MVRGPTCTYCFISVELTSINIIINMSDIHDMDDILLLREA
jgi:hypothetical protein